MVDLVGHIICAGGGGGARSAVGGCWTQFRNHGGNGTSNFNYMVLLLQELAGGGGGGADIAPLSETGTGWRQVVVEQSGSPCSWNRNCRNSNTGVAVEEDLVEVILTALELVAQE
jgi:hypothetical protein